MTRPFVAFLLVVAACSANPPIDLAVSIEATEVEVVRVVDGDTIDVRLDAGDERVRLIGINANEQGECGYDQAKERLAELVEGRSVVLFAEQTDRDRNGRLLRYVEVAGVDVGAQLVAEGWVLARSFPPDTARDRRYGDAETKAQEDAVGIWGVGDCASTATVTISELRADPPGNDLENLNEEWVEIRGGESPTDMSGWVLRDESTSNRYEFPASFVLEQEATIKVHSGCGTDDGDDLYWCQGNSPIWNNDGDQALLLDADGNIAASEAHEP